LAKSFRGSSRLKNHKVFIQGEAKKATGKATPTKYLNDHKIIKQEKGFYNMTWRGS